jgi:type II secretory pathway pseudopilin PulG
MRRLTSQNGVNYIQMLLVIVTAGIMAALVIPYLLNRDVEELQAIALQRAERIAVAQEEFYATHGLFTMERDSLLTALADSTDLIDPT